jgi:hypothetical protein
MANTLRIKRRVTGNSGAPAALKNAELAYNEVDDILYYGKGSDVNGDAITIPAIGGPGFVVNLAGSQTISGNKTFTGTVGLAGATVDSINTTGSVVVGGDLTVNGTTTTINSTTISVDDKNIELGDTAEPTDAGADGGGLTLKGTTDKLFRWLDATDSWTSSEHIDLGSGKEYKIGGVSVLTGTSLGSGVTGSSLTSVGTIGTGVWQGTTIGTGYGGTGQTSYTDGQLLVGNTATGGLSKTTLTAGTGITITNGNGTITIAAQELLSAGDGLDLNNGVFSVDLKANGGLVIESTELAVDLGASSITGTLAVGDGGTGQTSYTNGQLLIGNTAGGLSKATLTAGTNVTITNGDGAVTIASTDTTYTAGAGLVATGTTFDVVSADAGRIVVNADNIDLATTGVAAGTYRSVTTDTYGRITAGTNPTTLSGYGITDAQPLDATLTALAGVTVSADKLIYATAADTFTVTSLTSFGRSLIDDADAAGARTTLGLGTIATQNANNVAITGGTIDNVTIDGGTF